MNNIINKIGLDKITHFAVGFVIAISFTLITIMQDANYSYSYWFMYPIIGIIVTFVFAGTKELIDNKGDIKDFVASIIGAICIYIPIIIGILFNYLSK